ncbi:MAG: Intracellular distribution of mitochondria [Caeruleum heppii]|nr:MAG: Intracellular distribution of mitochondria [Caeruleum heppii]
MGLPNNHDANTSAAEQPTSSPNHLTQDASPTLVAQDAPVPPAEQDSADDIQDAVFQLTVILPHEPSELQIMVSTQEQVQDVRQSIVEFPEAFQYSCFHLQHNGSRINDFIDLSEVPGLRSQPTLKLVEDPYTEKDARMHVVRIRELVGAAAERTDTLLGVSAGVSLHDTITANTSSSDTPNAGASAETAASGSAIDDYSFDGPGRIRSMLPPAASPPPRTIKAISLSPWNPPPYSLRQKGHLIYLQVTTNEGEQIQVTGAVSGFFVNKCSNSKFDPFPRPPPKGFAAHSLLTLISDFSPSFSSSFIALQEHNNRRDPLSTFQLTNAIPANPWLVSSSASALSSHHPDLTRTQETYLIAGLENAETLRDWNEEFQSTRELPRTNVQERLFRERLASKLFADYTDAAARGAVLVARGEVAPLNPTETRNAQIFVYNNVFFSFGADGVGTFASEGGDEAARVATGKDVSGVRIVNQLDIDGLFTPGTVVVDYLGKRMVGQSIVPGIFKQRAPGEHQIDYGGVEGRDVVAENESFAPTFATLSKAMKVKRHPVWDKDGKRHDLEGSIETKGLLGTDGRKYVLDLYRLTPLDISWLEEHGQGLKRDITEGESAAAQGTNHNYPHRMAVLRPELVDAYWRLKMRQYINENPGEQVTAATHTNGILEPETDDTASSKAEVNGGPVEPESTNGGDEEAATAVAQNSDQKSEAANTGEQARIEIDLSRFSFALNPDVFNGQEPQTEEEKAEWVEDEAEVRAVCQHLHSAVIPELIHDLGEGDVGFPMDGCSLSRLMHKRGINVRYLGKMARLAQTQTPPLSALRDIALREMLSRAFKHVANHHLRHLPTPFAASCITHLLNCLLGVRFNSSPTADIDDTLRALFPDANFDYGKVTPESLQRDLSSQVRIRYDYDLESQWEENIKHVQLLREISQKLGLQLEARHYHFDCHNTPAELATTPHTNGVSNIPGVNGSSSGGGKKKKKHHVESGSPTSSVVSGPPVPDTTFHPDDIVNVVPVVKDAAPRSALAEEALEAGRISIAQNQKELGQELLLESLSLHEQIYGILHPEVARVYGQLSMLYYQLEEKSAAVELARKAVIVSERTLGVDAAETVLSYLNLGLFEHAAGNTPLALTYIRHALELWKIIYGSNHPDLITTINNAAVMLQHLRRYHESRVWFEASLQISEEVFGRQSPNTATLLYQLAQALALDLDSKGAVVRMREAYNIYLNTLGKDNKNTKEAESWLEQLTQNAVNIAKHAKDLQSRRVRRVPVTPRINMGTRPQPPVGGPSSAPLGGGTAADARSPRTGLDSRSIEELMRFIEGGGDSSKRINPKKRAGQTNPRRRGGGVIGAAA